MVVINDLVQRQRRDRRDSFSSWCHFWQNAPARERRSRCPLEPVLGGRILEQEASTNIFTLQIIRPNYVSLFDHLEWLLRQRATRYPITTPPRLDHTSSQSKVYFIFSRIPGLGMSCANSSPSATPVTKRVSWGRVIFDKLPELERSKNNNPAGPRMLGAIPMKILAAIFPPAQRMTLIGMINNKQIAPIQLKMRRNFAWLLSEFPVFCMTIQFNQSISFDFTTGRPTK